jgi:hypothetical protein
LASVESSQVVVVVDQRYLFLGRRWRGMDLNVVLRRDVGQFLFHQFVPFHGKGMSFVQGEGVVRVVVDRHGVLVARVVLPCLRWGAVLQPWQ